MFPKESLRLGGKPTFWLKTILSFPCNRRKHTCKRRLRILCKKRKSRAKRAKLLKLARLDNLSCWTSSKKSKLLLPAATREFHHFQIPPLKKQFFSDIRILLTKQSFAPKCPRRIRICCASTKRSFDAVSHLEDVIAWIFCHFFLSLVFLLFFISQRSPSVYYSERLRRCHSKQRCKFHRLCLWFYTIEVSDLNF